MSTMLATPTSASSSSYALSIEAPTPTPTPTPSPTTKRCTPAVILSIVLLTSLLLALAIALPLVLSRSSSPTPPPTSLTITYARPSNSSLWAVSHRAPPSSPHTFHWLFPQRNLDWLSAEFDALTTPTSPRFQQWHSLSTLHAQLAPTPSSKAAVLAYLTDGGVPASSITDHGDALQVDTTVDTVETLFSTRLHVMQHAETGQEAVRSVDGTAAVPVEVAPLLERLQGVTEYPHPVYHLTSHRVAAAAHAFHPMQTEETNAQCSRVSSYYALAPPSLLVSAYNFTDRSSVTTPSPTRNMVTAFGGQAMSVPDLAHFQVNVGASAPFTATIVNAATNTANLASSGIGTEANLDIQAVFQIAPTANNSFYASTSSGSLLAAMQAITNMPAATRPQVVSISYGFGASDYSYHAGDAGRTDTQFQQMGALGITVIASSGDDGTSGSYNRQCSHSPNRLGYGTVTPLASTPFVPGYPAASPYVLSVGETDFVGSATSSSAAYGAFSTSVRSPPECNNCPTDQSVAFLCQATNLGEQPVSAGAKSAMAGQTSGGGFSTVYSTPSWQSSQVRGYFGNCTSANGCTLPPSTYYTSTNRGYPDIAVFGGSFGTVINGKESVVGGTSVSAPLLAGLISRLNEVQLAKTGTTLGFINPLLYAASVAKPSTFHDLKTGENACPQGNSACATFYQKGTGSTNCSGFYSAPGWDPVTGLGSPNIGQLIDYIKSL